MIPIITNNFSYTHLNATNTIKSYLKLFVPGILDNKNLIGWDKYNVGSVVYHCLNFIKIDKGKWLL